MNNNKVAEAEYEEAGTWVFWDIDGCSVRCKAQGIAQKLSAALDMLNYRGPVSISAYGNMNHIPPSIKQALSSTGIVLNHVSPNVFRSHISNEMSLWLRDIPAPANLMLISGYELLYHFSPSDGIQHSSGTSSTSFEYMVASAKTKWLWRSLLEDVRGNQSITTSSEKQSKTQSFGKISPATSCSVD